MSIGKLLPVSTPQIGKIGSGELKKPESSTGNTIDQFGNMLTDGLKKVDHSIKDFENLSNKFANGDSVSIHELIIKGEQADISLRMMSTIKNKVLEAYTEIMHMQV